MKPRKILVTAALPYANGPIHIGHLVSISRRHLGSLPETARPKVHLLCADDTHGTAIMIRARAEGRSEYELIADMQAAHQRDFAKFDIPV